MTENIVHLVLAKLPDAPEGSKGISLFLVPKFIPNQSGELGQRNHVSCGAIEEKMGIHGSPTCVMNFDGAKGWLIGEPHAGLACMFTMMNYERLVVGIQGLGVAEHAYQTARSYALERLQGRATLSGLGSKGPSPIIDHQDVRRMLLEGKCLNEAGRAFYVYVATWLDRSKFSKEEKEKREAADRVALLTPVVKAFLTDRSFDTCVLAQQVLGGHGFIREWGQEQHVRDCRITQIYEGTNGVQAMDFAGRKTVGCKGRLIEPYVDEMKASLENMGSEEGYLKAAFEAALNDLEAATCFLVESESPEASGAGAVDYLNLVGYLSYAYMFVLQLNVLGRADETSFGAAKRKLARYYFSKLLPATGYLRQRILAGSDPASDFGHDDF